MLRILFITMLGAALAACGGSGGEDTAAASQSDDGLNPAALTVESPPSNGKLPADLLPPA